MIKKVTTLLILSLLFTVYPVKAQPWHYDFGTSTGSFSSGSSTSFLPVPPTDSARVRVGTGGGSFNLENQLIPFGLQSYLRISAATNTSVNKFSLYDFTGGKFVTLKFKILLGSATGSSTGATSGNWVLIIGDGATFSDNNNFNGSQTFTGLQFNFGTGGTISTMVRNSSTWVSTGITGTPFSQGISYIVEIYANNSTSTQNYTYGSIQSVAPNTWDLWVDGILAGDDISKAGIANNVNLDSWMFIGSSSTSNAANIFLDEFDYTNEIAGVPLPVTMSSFELIHESRNVKLLWSTSSELNNKGFDIERGNITGTGAAVWKKIGFVNGTGTTNEPQYYTYEDKNLNTGKYNYRLKQVDYNGNFEYFSPANNPLVTVAKPQELLLKQNYPNPSNPVSKIDFQLPFDGFVKLAVYDITGKEVMQLLNGNMNADYYSITFNGSNLASGIYFYRLEGNYSNEKYSKTMKMLLVK